MTQINYLISLLLLVSFLFSSDSDNDMQHSFPKIKINDVKEGTLLGQADENGYRDIMPNLHTNVHVDVKGMISSTTVDQVFTNDSEEPIEAIYVFPLPTNAAVNHMTMIIDDRLIEGKIKEKEEAKKIYEKAKVEGKRATLTEQQRPNIFTNSVSNIMPGDTIIVRIKYVNEVKYEKGTFSFRFPMVVAPRYIPGNNVKGYSGNGWAFDTDLVPDASKITPPVIKPNERSKNSISLSVNLDVGLDIDKISSSSHRINVNKKIEGLYSITLNKDKHLPNKDFILEYSIKKGREPKAALFVNSMELDDGKSTYNENYFMLMAMPPEENFNEMNNMEKEMIFIIDVSGSMSGTSIEQAKSSLIYAINKLDKNDTFNVIPFQSNYTSLSQSTILATSENKKEAIKYINMLSAGGGTEMARPLEFAMKIPHDENKIKMIVFITDGAVGNEQQLFNLVKNNLGNSRLFSIGIGSAPNSHLLEKISRKGRGTFTYISDISDVSTKVTKLFDKIEAPVLTNIQLSLDGKSEIYPNPIPDLFMDEPLVVFGKVDNVKNLSATFSGKNNYGHFKIDIPISFTNSEKHPSISGIWARKKIASYMDDWHLSKDQQVKQKVIDIALAHNLVSKFTSFVAVEHKIVNPTGNAIPVPIKVNLPEGWNYDKVFGAPREIMKNQAPIDIMKKNQFILPKTGTNMPNYLIYGLILILFSTWVLINPQIKYAKKK